MRRRIPAHDGHEYRLTAAGRELQQLIATTAEWGMRWARGQMAGDELDVGALMADIERRLDPAALPGGRTVLHLRFTDLERFGAWWVRIDDGEVELCLHDPGDEVDVYFTGTLRTMTEVWMGDVPLAEARRPGALKIVGREAWLHDLSTWFPLHVLAATPRAAREHEG